MQDFWISMYLLNMAAIAKHEADENIATERKNKQNKYEYQANVNAVIESMRNRLAEAVFCLDLESLNTELCKCHRMTMRLLEKKLSNL